MTPDDICAWFEREGLALERLRDNLSRTRVRAGERAFPLVVHFDERWVGLAIVPLVRLPPDPDDAERLMVRLLGLNREMNLAKFSVDDDGDVVLSVDWLLAALAPTQLRDALDALAFYADRHHAEIEAGAASA